MSAAGGLRGRRVALGVTGGIAAYKAIECVRLLTEAGAEVRVIMTPEATRFVAPLTFEALSYHPVASDWLEARGAGEPHVELSQWAEVVAIVPATANTIAKLATRPGRRDPVRDRAGHPGTVGARPGDARSDVQSSSDPGTPSDPYGAGRGCRDADPRPPGVGRVGNGTVGGGKPYRGHD